MRLIHDKPRTVDVSDLLARPLFAHLATVHEGIPRDSPVWFLWEEEALWIIGSLATDTFPERIAREPRCAIGIVDFDRSSGLVQHVGFRGRATIEAFDRERVRRLLTRYLGDDEVAWDERFRTTLANREADANVLVRFDPDTAVARDVSYAAALDPWARAGDRGLRPATT